MNDFGEDEWFCSINCGIDEIRMMYNHICYAIESWPGSPKRPVDEQEFLWEMREKYFAMLMEYNYSENDSASK
jgi:hypothetical protein